MAAVSVELNPQALVLLTASVMKLNLKSVSE